MLAFGSHARNLEKKTAHGDLQPLSNIISNMTAWRLAQEPSFGECVTWFGSIGENKNCEANDCNSSAKIMTK
jgi:hypothetical protein